MTKKLWIGLPTLAMVIIAVIYFSSQKDAAQHQAINTVKAARSTIEKVVMVSGQVVPRNEVEIKSQVSGVVEHLHVLAGQIVEKDSLLARIELIPNVEHLHDAEVQLEKAKIRFDNSSKEFDKQRKLFKSSIISESIFNEFAEDFEIVEKTLTGAQQKVDLIKKGFASDTGRVSNLVRSTTKGMILELPVEEGDYVTETSTFNDGTTIAYIANMDDLIFRGNIDESEVALLREGSQVKIIPGALNGQSVDGVLEFISPKGKLDQGLMRFEIKAKIEKQNDIVLRAGYSANARIVLARKENVLSVPEKNIIFTAEGPRVKVLTESKNIELRPVKLGISDGAQVEILDGVTEEDAIIAI